MNKITAQVGQIIEVNGKQYRATESGFELVVKRGPLGGEAARLPDIVGRWVAVRIDSAEPAFSSTMLAIGYGGPLGEFFRHNTPIFLIEGVDL